jgi:hypothetical protein
MMPIRVSSIDGLLNYALSLAKKKKCETAVGVLLAAKAKGFATKNFKKAALIYFYCGRLLESEECWIEVDRQGAMAPGDFYMLGSLQADLRKSESAMKSLEREIELSKTSPDNYFLGSSAIVLASLLMDVNDWMRAKNVLELVQEGEGGFIPNIGYRKKSELISKIKEALEN